MSSTGNNHLQVNIKQLVHQLRLEIIVDVLK